MNADLYVCMYVCLDVRMYHAYTCMHAVCVCMYTYVHIHRYRKKTRTPLDFETCACACAKLCSKYNGRCPLPRIPWLQPEIVVRDTPMQFFVVDYTRHAGWGAKTRREGGQVQI